MEYPDALYLHAFNLLPQFGPKRIMKLANYFASFETAFRASKKNLALAGIEPDLCDAWFSKKQTININEEFERLEQIGIGLLDYNNDSYPTLLKEISGFPPLLYIRGALPDTNGLAVAAVGTRKITTYGKLVTPRILGPLIDAGVIIVSGLAYGVDTLAHKQAVEKDKPTIAVLGGGLDDASFYPKNHLLFAQEIIDAGGCIVSEYPPGTPPLKQYFVARDRIISGLAIGTIIIECDLKSGSLITAQYALDQNRRLYAIPGPIYAPESRGPNNLIRMGATLVTEAKDILEDLNISPIETLEPIVVESPEERVLLELLSQEPMQSDALVVASGLSPGQVSTTLTFLEMKGLVRNLGGQQYIRSR